MDAATEDAVIRNRIALDNRPLRKIVKRFETLRKAVEAKGGKDSTREAFELFSTDLTAFQLSVRKQKQMREMNGVQQSHFASDLCSVQDGIQAAKADIEELKVMLVQEQTAAKRKTEYDAVARKCLELPSREESERNMATLREEILALQQTQQRLVQSYAYRKTLLHNVVSAIYTMKDAIENDGDDSRSIKKERKDEGGSNASLLASGEGGEEGEEEEEDVFGSAGRRKGGASGAGATGDDVEEGAYNDDSKMEES
ncbi:Tho complex subunit 7-domain-containing protein [Chytriomyces cf. hyalinus JEL632]|nr:Tho complex subunit 7-domain-containing protein [Chytriomyces cf. hyalinus JEL632]